MADRLRVAVIGTGAMGSNHIRVYNELAGAELVAVADTNEAALGASRVRAYTSYQRLLEEERPDAVSIAVPARTHQEVALACIERGIAVLVEKPIAAATAEGETLRDAAAANETPLMVGHIERFNPAVQELKRRLDAGELGRVYQASARRAGPFFRRERDVGVVHDLATHDIDVLHYLLGAETEQVHAETLRGIKTEHEDTLTGILLFEGGSVAQIEANWVSPAKQRELVLLGEHGMFVLDYIERALAFYPNEGEAEGAAQRIPIPAVGIEPLRAELGAFLRVVRREEPAPISAADGISALRVADALVEAGRTGQPVRLKEARAAG